MTSRRVRTMVEREGGGDWVQPFAWGFVVGALVCLGAGGIFYFRLAARNRALEAEAQAVQAALEAAEADAVRQAEMARVSLRSMEVDPPDWPREADVRSALESLEKAL